jgi:hypothetical protein
MYYTGQRLPKETVIQVEKLKVMCKKLSEDDKRHGNGNSKGEGKGCLPFVLVASLGLGGIFLVFGKPALERFIFLLSAAASWIKTQKNERGVERQEEARKENTAREIREARLKRFTADSDE